MTGQIRGNGSAKLASNADSMDLDSNPFDPPPSTLAAQLVNNLSSTRNPSLQGSQNHLSILFLEIKKYESRSDRSTDAEDAEFIGHNHRVVYVVTKVCLDPVCGGDDDVFSNKEKVLEDAEKALDVIITPIKETPTILVKVSEANNLVRTGRGVPLWVWLWPRLLRLYGKKGCETLWEKIDEFFQATFELVKGRQTEFWGVEVQLISYLRHCADAALHRVAGTSRTTLPLPTIEDEISLPGNPDFIKDGCTYTLEDGSDAFRQADRLLTLLIGLSCSPSMGQLQESDSFGAYAVWILDNFLELRTVAARSSIYTTQQEEVDSCWRTLKNVHKLLISMDRHVTDATKRKGYRVLAYLCAELVGYLTLSSDISDPVQFCSILLDLASACQSSVSLSQTVAAHLQPNLTKLLESEAILERSTTASHHLDLQNCILLLRQKCEESLSHLRIPHDPITITDETLESQFRSLSFKSSFTVDNDDQPRSKRRKLIPREPLEEITEQVYLLLGAQKATDLDGLSQVAAECFSQLEDTERSKAMRLLGMIPCAGAGTLTVTLDRHGEITDAECTVCDGIGSLSHPTITNSAHDGAVETHAVAILSTLIKTPEFESARKPRILAMIALRKFALHFEAAQFMDLEESPLGQWCLTSLRSSVRELRIAAGRTLPAFLRDCKELQISCKNRVNVLNLLRECSDDSPMHLTETWVLAWGQIARASKDRELNLALLRLVEYLGHTNQVISAVAFNEILNTAERQGVPVGQMFSPFWRTIAHTAVKDLQSRPQTAQLLAELLSISVSELLVNTQAHTLPWLVLDRKTDVIGRISQACDGKDPSQIILDNMAAIMPRLLVQRVPDIEAFILQLLRNISSDFNDIDLVECVKIAPIDIALELLKNAGDENDTRKSRTRYALNTLAAQCNSSSDTQIKRKNQIAAYVEKSRLEKKGPIGIFLEQYSLAIMSHFSDLLNDTRTWQSSIEKRRALKGIEEMIKVGKRHVRSALPQIYACLQSALSNDELRSTAFQAWGTMIRSLDDDDVADILESTFSTIIQQWQHFDDSAKKRAQELIEYVLDKRFQNLGLNADLLPSLAQIPELLPCQSRLDKMRSKSDMREQYNIFCERIAHEHASVVIQGLTELAIFLRKNQDFLQASAASEQPDKLVGELLRAILDVCVKFNGSSVDIARLSAECIGLIGCLDPNRVEAVRERNEFVMVSNFDDPGDTTNFALFLLEEVLVKAFLSATNPKYQGFFSYVMQELLRKCDFSVVVPGHGRTREQTEQTDALYEKWINLPDNVRMILTPFLNSRYTITAMPITAVEYPIFQPNKNYNVWLRTFVLDFLQKPRNPNAMLLFNPLCRVIKIEDTSVANFLLPYVVLHNVALGSDLDRKNILEEIMRILAHEAPADAHHELNNVRLCSEAVFRILDYLARWTQEEKAALAAVSVRTKADTDEMARRQTGLGRVGEMLSAIPAEVISRRAVECKSYARALFHWEAHIRKFRSEGPRDKAIPTSMLEHLQDIYAQIDEPDGIEGISAHLHVLDIDQQILGHRKAGRWTAAQSWYEIRLAENPDDADAQVNLLHCMKESGQHDVLLNYVQGMSKSSSTVSKLLPFATEASWETGRWDMLEKYVSIAPVEIGGNFNVNIGRTLLALLKKDYKTFDGTLESLREHIAGSLSADTTSSLAVCHDSMLKLHALTELEMIAQVSRENEPKRVEVLQSLDRRLEVIGSYLNDKQYLLGLRRATMQLCSPTFTKADVASAWLTSARLARKGNSMHQPFNAVLQASKLGDDSAMIEHARLIWKEGNHRKAIQSLQGAIANNAFVSHNQDLAEDATGIEGSHQQNLLAAHAHLLLAKWLDNAGQTHSTALRAQYQRAAQLHQTWERGHYYLGRHYNKLLESEKALPPELQAQPYLTGEMARLVIENYLRSLNYGTKYVYQTLPRVLTLWLDLGMQVTQPIDPRHGTKEFIAKLQQFKKEQLASLHTRFNKYIHKMPAYIFYTALSQIVARIAHPNPEVYRYLEDIIVKVVTAHPQQALWNLLAVSTSTQLERKNRGALILRTLISSSKKTYAGGMDLRTMIEKGQKLSQQLLHACTAGEFPSNRTHMASITKDLGFNPKYCCPSPLAVPVESALTATLPTLTDNVRSHKAFSRDVITIVSFLDQVMVLSSLQKPRKLTARGSDGKTYGLLCKPKDDLRKDQRLMEFNSMINRSLKRDAESSKRQLYIKTYAVTPLNEECGIIEWVDGLKTLRDIILGFYKVMGVTPNYAELRVLLDEANKSEDKLPVYAEKVFSQFPPVFHHWFVQQFPEPSAWFGARLKYTRSCAVMSMVGTILGLGDRHGENILFEEGNGGTFHVDFNCLFDKGLTFQQPERVPFRLTQNMIDAMGVYGYEGPFRTSCELTLKLLRQHEETLMTILEAFVYDPTLDLLESKGKKKRERESAQQKVPNTPQGVLDSIRRKVRGLLVGESVPLGVEGQVDELIKQATSEKNLVAMYIGWCAFF